MLLLSFDHYQAPAENLAKLLGIPYKKIELHRFPDGESLVQLPADLPKKLIICQTFDFPNDKLIELYIAAQSARQQGVEEITLVAPYLCYMRQDIAFKPGQAVTQKIIGPFLASTFDNIITVDPHLHRIKTLDEAIPTKAAVSLTAANELGKFVVDRFKDAVFIGPDEESEQWVSVVAQPGGNDVVVATKNRYGDRSVEVMIPEYDWLGKTAVLVDDVISSGHTMAEAAKKLHQAGCAKIIALCTHALLAPGAEDLLKQSYIDELISTDSIPHSSNQIPLASLLADALKKSEIL